MISPTKTRGQVARISTKLPRLLTLLAAACTVACTLTLTVAPVAATTGKPVAGAATGGEVYKVYSASLPFGYHMAGLAVAIRSRTVPVPDLQGASRSVRREFQSMQTDPEIGSAVRQMMTQKPSTDLAPRFHLGVPVELLDSDDLDGVLRLNDTPLGRKAGWKAYTSSHSNADGLTELSAVGFNPAHTIAVFYAIDRSGTGCNDEGFEVMEKTNGRWRRAPDKGFSFAACN